ncbi:Fc.00g102070.m01.CDS01 [Cosmosporella sp. VM-42]
MPQALDQPQNRAQDVARIATSNQTLNHLMGGSRHSWMANGNSTTPQNVLVSAPGQTCKSFNITARKRGRPSKDSLLPLMTTSDRPTPVMRHETNIIEQQVERIEPQTTHPVLPSPAPTDEPSPALSIQNDSPESGNGESTSRFQFAPYAHTNPEDVTPSASIAANPGQTGAGGTQTDDGTSSRLETTRERVASSGTGAGIHASGANRSSELAPTGHQTQPLPQHNGEQASTSRTARAEDAINTDSGAMGRPSKRARLETSAQASNPESQGLAGLMQQWRRTLRARMALFQGSGVLTAYIEQPRYKLIDDACTIHDLFYLALHQVFCLWTVNRAQVYQMLAPLLASTVVDSGFDILQTVLRKNENISRPHLDWFSQFPGPISGMMHTHPDFRVALLNITEFLTMLSQHWQPMIDEVERRLTPFMSWELRYGLKCGSPSIQMMLFTVSRRKLGMADGPLSVDLNTIFQRDQAYEDRIAGGGVPVEDVNRARGDFTARYAQLIRLARQQAGRQAAQQRSVSSPTIQHPAPMAPQRNRVTSSQPSPNTSDPQTSLPGTSMAKSPSTPQAETSFPQAQIGIRRVSTPTAATHHAPPGSPNSSHPQAAVSYQVQPGHYSPHLPPRPSPLVHHQPPPLGPSVPIPSRPHSTHQLQGLPPPPPVPSQPPHPGTQRRASSFQYPSQAISGAQRVTPHNPPNQGLQYPQAYVHPAQNQVPPSTHAVPPHMAQPRPLQYSDLPRPGVVVPTTGYAPPARHLIASQRPMPQPIAPGHPAFPPFPMIPENEYATGPYDHSSIEVGLHQVEIRSPQRVPATPISVRHYQFIKELAVPPCEIHPQMTLRALSFDLTGQNMERLSRKLGTALESEGLPFSQYCDGSLRYRLRLCLRPRNEQTLRESDWAVSAAYWPENIVFELNGHMLELRRKPHYHKDMPLELTDFLLQGENKVRICLPQVQGNYKTGYKHVVGVEVVETRSHDSLRAGIETFQRVPADETMRKVQRRLRPSDSDEIIIQDETLSVSLADPFSSTMFEVPVRGVDCQHLECFDLETWLQTRPMKPKQQGKRPSYGGEPTLVDVWKCPICSLDARPLSLRVDEFFVSVRKMLLERNESNVRSITLDANGTWSPVQEPDDVDEDTPAPSNTQVNDDRVGSRKGSTAPVIEILDD